MGDGLRLRLLHNYTQITVSANSLVVRVAISTAKALFLFVLTSLSSLLGPIQCMINVTGQLFPSAYPPALKEK